MRDEPGRHEISQCHLSPSASSPAHSLAAVLTPRPSGGGARVGLVGVVRTGRARRRLHRSARADAGVPNPARGGTGGGV